MDQQRARQANNQGQMLPPIASQGQQNQPMYEIDQQVYNEDDYDDEYYDSQDEEDSDTEEAKRQSLAMMEQEKHTQQQQMSKTDGFAQQKKKDGKSGGKDQDKQSKKNKEPMIPPTDLDGEGQSAQKLKNNNEADLEKNEADGGDQDQ